MTERRAVRYGRKGGRKRVADMTPEQLREHSAMMNQARTSKLSPERRSEIARIAAAAKHGKGK